VWGGKTREGKKGKNNKKGGKCVAIPICKRKKEELHVWYKKKKGRAWRMKNEKERYLFLLPSGEGNSKCPERT